MYSALNKFNLQPTLIGKIIRLSPLKENHFNDLFMAASDPLIWQQHPNPDRYKESVFKNFFSEALKSGGAFVVIDLKTEKIIGSSRYYDLDLQKSQVVIGYTFLMRKYWGGVYNRELKSLMLEHAFGFVKTVHFHVDEKNTRSQIAMEKIGGRRTGEFCKPGSKQLTLIYTIEKIIN